VTDGLYDARCSAANCQKTGGNCLFKFVVVVFFVVVCVANVNNCKPARPYLGGAVYVIKKCEQYRKYHAGITDGTEKSVNNNKTHK